MAKGLLVTCSAMMFIKSKNKYQKANKHFFLKTIYGQLVCNFTIPLQTMWKFLVTLAIVKILQTSEYKEIYIRLIYNQK